MISPKPEPFAAETEGHWKPHRESWNETPILFFLAKDLSIPLLTYWIRIRNFMLRNVVLDWRLPFPCWKRINRTFTFGELIVFLFFVIGTICFCFFTIYSKWEVEFTGIVALAPIGLAFALSAHNSVFTFLLGIPFERALFWHKLVALAGIAAGWCHGVRAFQENLPYDYFQDKIANGLMFAIPMTVMFFLSLEPVRRYVWNLFYLFHIVVAIAIIPIGVIHGKDQYATNAGFLFAGIGFWGLDLLFRYIYLAFLKNPHTVTAKPLAGDIIRLTFKRKGFTYAPGQYMFVMIPKVNIFEWHPFSISSSPHQETVTIHLKALGNWTKTLYDKIKTDSKLQVFMEGPYGAPEINTEVSKYKIFMLISGGIGITPMQSMCSSLLYQKQHYNRPLKKIRFVWSCSDKHMMKSVFEPDRESALNELEEKSQIKVSIKPLTVEKLTSIDLDDDVPNGFHKDSIPAHTLGEDDILQCDLHLTRTKVEEGFEDANIPSELHHFIKYGRPKLGEIFEQTREFAKKANTHHVAALSCGPQALMDEVRGLCGKHSKDGIMFDFHGELFDF